MEIKQEALAIKEDILGISFGSINTGLPKDIVKQIIAAEKIPLQKMEERKSKIQDKKKLVTELTTIMKNVKKNLLQNGNARSLRELKVSANEDIVDVTVDKNIATPGSHQFEVVRLAQKSSAMSVAFEDKDDSYTGVGFIQYYLPNGDSREIYVDSDHASLNGIAKLINKNTDSGMRASVIDDGSGKEEHWRILVSLKQTGDENKATWPHFYFVDGYQDFYLEKERPAQDALVRIDGFEVEVPENKVKDMIPGVTVDLLKAEPGEEFTINIGEDAEAVSGKINDLVETINLGLSFIKEQNTLDENTDTSRTLGGDLLLQSLESRIRGIIFKGIKTSKGFQRLGDLGINFKRDGLLEVEQKKFDAIIARDYSSVSDILTGSFTAEGIKNPGFIDNFKNLVDQTLQFPSGLLTNRQRGLDNKLDQIDRRIEQKQRLINQKEQTLKDKFARLEGQISKIQSQGAGVAALGGGNAASAVTQLG
jgi:flagellar hook-associated protein 2